MVTLVGKTVNLLEHRVFADIINLRCSHAALGWALTNMAGTLLRRAESQTWGEFAVMMETEIGAMHLQTEECPGLLATPEAKRKSWNKFSYRVSKRAWHCWRLDSGLLALQLWENKCLLCTVCCNLLWQQFLVCWHLDLRLPSLQEHEK